jgi:hypothetical protein
MAAILLAASSSAGRWCPFTNGCAKFAAGEVVWLRVSDIESARVSSAMAGMKYEVPDEPLPSGISGHSSLASKGSDQVRPIPRDVRDLLEYRREGDG